MSRFGDATLGLWVGELAYAGVDVTLVDTPKVANTRRRVRHEPSTRKRPARRPQCYLICSSSSARPTVCAPCVFGPQFVSHHPLPSTRRGAFGNSSIVLHGLKDRATDEYWHYAKARGAGQYVPPPRQCARCDRQGWVTWPTSPLKRWRCCGPKIKRRPMRQWPRTVLEGMAMSDPGLRDERKAWRARTNSSRLSSEVASLWLSRRLLDSRGG